MQNNKSDIQFMEIALRLAGRGLGMVAPNPAVGCVIVKNGQIVARGWTANGGRPHAETQALERAGERAKGATVYVTLEPCCHHGQTPPCVQALIDAEVERVVVAVEDPDERVSGKGIEALKDAGIVVEIGIGRAEAAELNAGFFFKVQESRPYVTLKLAISADGKIGRVGERVQITDERTTAYAHMLRKTHDAIMVGKATLEVDKPQLTCRLPGLEHASPLRVEASRDIKKKLNELADQGITRLLVEGGAKLAQSFLDSGFVDQVIVLENNNMIIGEEGIAAPNLTGYQGKIIKLI